ncbi:ACT domain-containing protein [Microbacterium sp. zg-YB36]|uniref:glycine cleavage system protein R n=1 Tax=Microbacterium sp. zg-YB36 TaxID=2969407 RepID=UPI00214C3209|nr:ACT domain-containing protein [Microbacterium sp. zg-YB36]MDL5350232.1 ACT domain-containing protein [Microbacterium sp. zg-YB36]
MAHLVLTIVGDDRSGLVQTLADTVATHGGNWERSEMAELAGAFAGIALVSVPDDRVDALRAALDGLGGLLRITTHESSARADAATRHVTFTVLGNDRPGIVRDVTGTLAARGLSIDSLTSRTLDAPMAGGTLFEAILAVRVPPGVETATITEDLERLAGEIQVDLAVTDV